MHILRVTGEVYRATIQEHLNWDNGEKSDLIRFHSSAVPVIHRHL